MTAYGWRAPCRRSKNTTGSGPPNRISRPRRQLSRYYDLGDGPAPEVLSSEKDAEGRTHYDLVSGTSGPTKLRLRRGANTTMPAENPRRRCSTRETGRCGNRDSTLPTGFGKFNIDVIHYDPVCLNSLLYMMEVQTAEILARSWGVPDAAAWRKRA